MPPGPRPLPSLRTLRTWKFSQSIEMYWSGWKMRSLRSEVWLTRLAETSATQPSANSMRALAMSTAGVSTGKPLARTAVISLRAKLRIRSMSWIMRSSTTFTSMPRGLKIASRSDSMNSGRVIWSRTARIAGLNRSRCPTWNIKPWRAASSTSSAASSTVRVTGFSTRMCTPASRHAFATSWCSSVGTTIDATSMSRSTWL